jgi:RND family efflux transporter MFP subunit
MNRLTALFEKDLASKKECDFARLAYQRSRRLFQEFKNRIELIAPRRAGLEASLGAGRADVELAKLDIERCRITAPFAGQVERIAVDVGDHVLPGGEVLRLMSTRRIEVPIELPASFRSRIGVGATCRLETDSMPGVHWDGSVARISPSADTRSRTFAAYVEVDNDTQETRLVPGYFVRASVDGPMLRQVLAVPRGAIIDDHVYVVNDDVAHIRTVRVEKYVQERAVVTGDLRPGDLVILTNLDVLYEGAEVRTEAHPAAPDESGGSGAGAAGDTRQQEPVIAEGKP